MLGRRQYQASRGTQARQEQTLSNFRSDMDIIQNLTVDNLLHAMENVLSFSSPTNLFPTMLDLSHLQIHDSLANTTTQARRMYGEASSGYGDSCCPPVVDPYTWLALIAGIGLATYFLRITITTTLKRKKRRKREGEEEIEDIHHVLHGNHLQTSLTFTLRIVRFGGSGGS
jgi:hypothetical protein